MRLRFIHNIVTGLQTEPKPQRWPCR